jgi:hypothetical protein
MSCIAAIFFTPINSNPIGVSCVITPCVFAAPLAVEFILDTYLLDSSFRSISVRAADLLLSAAWAEDAIKTNSRAYIKSRRI